MKILFITTVGATMRFFTSLVDELVGMGHTVDIATNQSSLKIPSFYEKYNMKIYNIDCERFPLKKENLKAIKQIKNIVDNGNYDIVHCHTPVAAACTRLACKGLRKKGVKVIYTAHGFHFYKGAPLKNWIIYYPIEKICARYTDCLITITKEDYELSKSKMKAKSIEYIPGVGIDVDAFRTVDVDVSKKRMEIGIPEDAFLLLSVGELNHNKNHKKVIEAIAAMDDPDIHYAIAGRGPLYDELQRQANSLNITERFHLLGHRTDVPELYKCANAYILPSIREGLNVSVMEAIASGLPVLCCDIRGNRDMIDKSSGILFPTDDIKKIIEAIKFVKNGKADSFSVNCEKRKIYDKSNINGIYCSVYDKVYRSV